MSAGTGRPAIGERFDYRGRRGEVRATYPGPDGICVVGVYDDAPLLNDDATCGDATHFVGRWCDCVPVLEAAA